MHINRPEMSYRIIILGDSSSSGIGIGRSCYPDKVFRFFQEDFSIDVHNCAVPGATSADVSRFFLSEVAPQDFDCVIVYLGNNEGSGGGSKGVYRPLRTRFKELLSKRRPKHFRPVLSPTRFQFTYDIRPPSIATTPKQFHANIRSIIRHAEKSSASVIVLNPVANARFPSGLGAPNATYFAYLDDLNHLDSVDCNNPIDEASRALALGLNDFASSRFENAVNHWKALAARKDVVGFIASHNVVCARARLFDFNGQHVLEELIGKYASYDGLVLYNLAQLARLRGDPAAMQSYLDRAYENDATVYRVKQSYREVLAKFESLNGVRVVDLNAILKPCHFIDYCHPTEEGHEIVARTLADIIRPLALPEKQAARKSSGDSRYRLSLPSPNYWANPQHTIVDYYGMDWPVPRQCIEDIVLAVSRDPEGFSAKGDIIAASIENFLRANSRHPVFAESLYLAGDFRPMSHEIFSFPEFFLYRVLYNYYDAFEQGRLEGELSNGSMLKRVRFFAEDYKRIILRANSEPLESALNLTQEYFDTIVERLKHELLARKDIYRVIIGHRIRTTMTWYTREAFRYGTQSRLSMLYARWDIEELIEALVVAIVIATSRRLTYDILELDLLLGHLLNLVHVHEMWVGIYHKDAEAFSAPEYQTALAEVEHAIKLQCGLMAE